MYSNSCEFEYFICCQVGSEYRVIGKLPAEIEVENYAIKQFSKIVVATLETNSDALPRLIEKAKEAKEDRINGYIKLREKAAPKSKLALPK
jgi:hypothetical protein